MREETRFALDEIDKYTAYLRHETVRLEAELKAMTADRDDEVATHREIQRACDFNVHRYHAMDDIVTEMVSLAVGRLPEGLLLKIQKVREERA